MRAGLSHRGFGPAPVRSENLRFSSSRQSPIFDRHGRGATFVAVGSSRSNSARRVELLRRLGLIRTVSDTPALIVGVHSTTWRGPDIRGRFTYAPPHLAGTCARRGLHMRQWAASSQKYGLETVTSNRHTRSSHSGRLPPHPTRLCVRRGPEAPRSVRVGPPPRIG